MGSGLGCDHHEDEDHDEGRNKEDDENEEMKWRKEMVVRESVGLTEVKSDEREKPEEDRED